jgi:transcriptional regulator with XRE-family HTH domain
MSERTTPDLLAVRLAGHAGMTITDARRRRSWTLRELADRANLAVSAVHAIEHGRPASLRTYSAIALALDFEPRLDLIDPRKRAGTVRAEDPVHSGMGEVIAARLASLGLEVAVDEPFQHYQFAGRADILAWERQRGALLHVENRTRFPNVQEAIGSFNTKRRYLAPVIATRLGLRGGFESVTHVIAGLWSAEVIHAVRIRPASFRAVCPDDATAFGAWWTGGKPLAGSVTSTFILFDPVPGNGGRRTEFVGLDIALRASTRPRYRGYAEAMRAIRSIAS